MGASKKNSREGRPVNENLVSHEKSFKKPEKRLRTALNKSPSIRRTKRRRFIVEWTVSSYQNTIYPITVKFYRHSWEKSAKQSQNDNNHYTQENEQFSVKWRNFGSLTGKIHKIPFSDKSSNQSQESKTALKFKMSTFPAVTKFPDTQRKTPKDSSGATKNSHNKLTTFETHQQEQEQRMQTFLDPKKATSRFSDKQEPETNCRRWGWKCSLPWPGWISSQSLEWNVLQDTRVLHPVQLSAPGVTTDKK